jgi:DNA-directed RNA polymerase specialized sigma24 family protein
MSEPVAHRRLATTRWSIVLAAADPGAPEARAALAILCETYWMPVYEFIRHIRRRTPDDARELTQAFFARVVERGDFGNARRDRGRFRSFLLTAVRHFLSNQMEYQAAQKRGGDRLHVSLDADSGSDDARPLDPPGVGTPETIYEHRWALTTLDTAMARLAREYERSGRGELFDGLRPQLTADAQDQGAALAARLGMTHGALRVALHRLRRQYGQCLRATLAETVSRSEDVEDELQYLLRVVSRPGRSNP